MFELFRLRMWWNLAKLNNFYGKFNYLRLTIVSSGHKRCISVRVYSKKAPFIMKMVFRWMWPSTSALSFLFFTLLFFPNPYLKFRNCALFDFAIGASNTTNSSPKVIVGTVGQKIFPENSDLHFPIIHDIFWLCGFKTAEASETNPINRIKI